MIEVPMAVADSCSNAQVRKRRDFAVREFEAQRQRNAGGELSSFTLAREDITDDLLDELKATAESINHSSFQKAIVALQTIRTGKMRSIPNRWALVESMLTYLDLNFIDGWVYRRSEMGFLQAIRVDGIYFDGYKDGYMLAGRSIEVSGKPIRITVGPCRTRGLPLTLMGDLNLLPETAELKKEYLAQVSHLIEVAASGPGHQCVADGLWTSLMGERDLQGLLNTGHNRESLWGAAKLEAVHQRKTVVESELNAELLAILKAQLADEVLPHRVGVEWAELDAVPVSPLLQVFDLSGEGDRIVAAPSLTSYEYREDIRSQLVLPESHSRVIDVLTSKTTSTLADVIHGKGAGNLVLCKGIPGVGKTLTAEIIAENLKRPMYTVDASSILGAKSVREAMNAAFDRVRRWDGVLLLDEADVVIGARGNDLERNRVTAELLRSLESFERLAFLTTNRPEDVDDAIISRCVAIIEYKAPTGAAAQRAWLILGEQLEQGLVSDELAKAASEHFLGMAPRDIRQLLRLSFQMVKAESRELDLETLKECAVFRAWEPAN